MRSIREEKRAMGAISLIFAATLSLGMLYAILHHSGFGVIRETRQRGPFLYALMWDGHVYEASRCKSAMSHPSGNVLHFTAIGLDISLFDVQIAAPKIVQCEYTGGWIDYMEPLAP